MMEMKWTISIFACILLVSCAKEKRTDNDIIYLAGVMNNPGEVKLSDLIDTIEYIRLETTEESLVGQGISYISCTSEYIFISESDSPLKVFKRDGSFLRTIGQIGRGPGEYAEDYQFRYNQDDNQIYILDYHGEIGKYGLDGNFIGRIKGEKVFAAFGILPGGNICATYGESIKNSTGTGMHNYVILDSNSSILRKYLIPCEIFMRTPIEGTDKYMAYAIPPILYNSGDALHIHTRQNDSSYVFKEDSEILISLRWNRGKYTPPKSSYAPRDDRRELDKYISFFVPARFGSAWYISYSYEGENHYAFFPDNGEYRYLGNESIRNDYDGGTNFWPFPTSISGMEFVSPYGVAYLQNKLAEGYFDREDILYPELNKKLKDLIISLDENENPLVRIVTIRESI